jgi:hypothetical protein
VHKAPARPAQHAHRELADAAADRARNAQDEGMREGWLAYLQTESGDDEQEKGAR